jgi:hypothetical protein
MTEFFFSQNTCGIGNEVEKLNFDFVASCDIKPTPPPIFDCELPLIVREPEIPCPVFTTFSTIDVAYGSSTIGPDGKKCAPPSSVKLTVDKVVDNTCPADNICNFDVDLEIRVLIPPPPCPEINIGTFKVTTGFAGQPCVNVPNKFTITPTKTPPTCTDPGRCQFTFDLEIVVPIPVPPCPTMRVGTFQLRTGFEDQPCVKDKGNRFTITTSKKPGNCNQPETCEFVVDLEINVPIPRTPCPSINVNTFTVATSYNNECPLPPSRFEIKKRERKGAGCTDPGSCDFDVDLEIYFPIPRPPCPEITISKFKVQSAYEGTPCNGNNAFTIRRIYEPESCVDPQKKDKCEFEIELEIFIPIPKPPCPTI